MVKQRDGEGKNERRKKRVDELGLRRERREVEDEHAADRPAESVREVVVTEEGEREDVNERRRGDAPSSERSKEAHS